MKAYNQSGIALVIVLWMLALLIILAAGYSKTMRTETKLVSNMVHTAQAKSLAEAGIYHMLHQLLNSDFRQQIKLDGSASSVSLNNHSVSVRVQDEAGKIDINTANAEILYNLFRSVLDDEQQVLSIVHSILDWRDRDNLTRNFGAEDNDYDIELGYKAKDGFFNSTDELLLVNNMTVQIYNKIRSDITIHSRQTGIHPQAASRKVLLAIPYINEGIVDEYLADRETRSYHNDILPLTGVDSRFLSNNAGNIYSISSEAQLDNTIARINAVISLQSPNDQSKPFAILAWHESPFSNPKKKINEDEI